MPSKKFLSKEDILRAMRATGSNRAAARYLAVSYPLYKRYAQLYKDETDNVSLFNKHLNRQGKGIPKWSKKGSRKRKIPAVLDIIEGRINYAHFTPQQIKDKLIQEHILPEQCALCGYNEHRIIDYKIPLLMHFKDNNKKNYLNGNVELLCYNCYFISVGNIYNEKDLLQIEGHTSVNNVNQEMVQFELDDYNIQRLKEIGLWEEDKSNSGEEFISKW
jgi:hypothetical protein